MKTIHNEDALAGMTDMASRPAHLPGLQPQPGVRLVYSRENFSNIPLPERMAGYPELRYMGSKRRLLPWIHGVLRSLPFETAADPFVGSGCVAYLLKTMGKRVVASDFLNFPAVLATATVANSTRRLDGPAVKTLLVRRSSGPNFIEKTFDGIFFNPEDLRFLDRVSGNLAHLEHPHQRAIAKAALIRSCLKKQPRGVFTVSGDLSHYDDGRRDLRLTIEEHFLEQIEAFNRVVFSNGRRQSVKHADVFSLRPRGIDLVYLDPPYVPRSDDNCYMKRYHFLEGLSCYWKGRSIMEETKVKKIQKPYTPFSYRRTAIKAFDRLFSQYRESIIVLSYSSNGFPDREELENLLRRYKTTVTAYKKPHRYHFGTHQGVERTSVDEYLIVGH
ncbi:MAG TPA: DNA adenine methylase [Bryobacteraceae bacterium]|nr:DNA adenine methylase [Bryobacteraceae bacterium]